jgi:hypothetical protein
LALTKAEEDVPPIRNADGKDNLFDFVSKKHDLAYDAAQQKLLGDLSNPNKSAQQVFHDYYSTLAKADREFLAEMAAGHPDRSLSGDPWETEALRRAKQAFAATALTNKRLARRARYTNPNVGESYRTLADVELKLRWLGDLVDGDVVGRRVKSVMDELRSRRGNLGGRPGLFGDGEAFAYVDNPEEAEEAYERRTRKN